MLNKARLNGVSLCIVDYHLPSIPCDRLISTLKNEFDLPCIIVTGDTSDETEKQARGLSPEFFFFKPLQLEDLKSVVENILKGKTA